MIEEIEPRRFNWRMILAAASLLAAFLHFANEIGQALALYFQFRQPLSASITTVTETRISRDSAPQVVYVHEPKKIQRYDYTAQFPIHMGGASSVSFAESVYINEQGGTALQQYARKRKEEE